MASHNTNPTPILYRFVYFPRPFPGKSTLPVPGFASWAVRDSTISFFVGNTTGMNSDAENRAEAKLGVVGLSW